MYMVINELKHPTESLISTLQLHVKEIENLREQIKHLKRSMGRRKDVEPILIQVENMDEEQEALIEQEIHVQ
jgi:hypothetical protein